MILLTTANFPDVMLPAYTVNKAYCLFFIFYLVFGLYFLLYLILAIYYSNYKNRIEKNLMKYEDIRKRYLFKKFDSYDHGNKGYLNRKELREMLGVIIKVKKKDMIRIVKNFQQRWGGKVTKEKFINFFDFMEFIQLENKHDNKYYQRSRRRSWIARIMQNPLYDWFMIIFVALNCLSIFAKDCMDTYGTTKESIDRWIYTEFAISLIFGIEMLFLFYWYGFMQAFKRRNHVKFEIVFQILNISIFIYFLLANRYDMMTKVLEITILLRMMRLLKLFNEVRQWRIIMQTMRALLTPFYTLLLVTYMLYLIFSIIGDRAFGGLANYNEMAIIGDDSIPDSYVQVNFNDLANSFVTLFILMVVNNWFVIWTLYAEIIGSDWVRLYFVAFYFLSVIVNLNILVAFVIDMYSSVESLNDPNKDKDETVDSM